MHPIYVAAKECAIQIRHAYGDYIPDYNQALLTEIAETDPKKGPNDTLKKYVSVVSEQEWRSKEYWYPLGNQWKNAYEAAQGHGTPAITVPRISALTKPDDKKYTAQKFMFVMDQEYKDDYLRHIVAHELIHWLTHRQFVANVKCSVEATRTVKEGTTEYLTRRLLNIKGTTGVYDEEARCIERVVTESETFPDFAKAYFGGQDKLETMEVFADFFVTAVERVFAELQKQDSKKSAGGKA